MTSHPDQYPTEEDKERERLFDLIRELVKWENVNNKAVLEQARREIRKNAELGSGTCNHLHC